MNLFLIFFFGGQENIKYFILNSNEFPNSKNQIIINYSKKNIPNSYKIIPYGLLDEKDIREIFPIVKNHDEYFKIFFETKEDASVPFDIFSASFWLLTRYEEHTEKSASVSGDFPHRSSLSWQNDFLDFPIVDHWKKVLFGKLGLLYNTNKSKNKICFPVDIELNEDKLNSKYHGEWGSILNLFKLDRLISIFPFKKNEFRSIEKLSEFDFFHQIIRSFSENQFIFFWNTANEKNNPLSLLSRFPFLHVFAKRLNDYAQTGLLLRGRFDTKVSESEISKFILRLRNIVHSEILHVRIKKGLFVSDNLNKKLQLNGLKHDYSGLFYHAFGYRFSTLSSFASFDLRSNRQTDIIIHPVCTCDTFLFDSDKDDFFILKLKQHLKEFGGESNILLHQYHYSDDLEGKRKKEKLLKWIDILNN